MLFAVLNVVGDQGADTFVSEYFQQHSMFDATVNNMGTGYTAIDRIQSTFNFGQHATMYGLVRDQRIHLGSVEPCKHFIVFALNAGYVSEQYQFFGPQDLG